MTDANSVTSFDWALAVYVASTLDDDAGRVAELERRLTNLGAVATLLEKLIRQPDQISRPNGYFRAMVDRAATGKLNLARSLFGLAQGTLSTQ